MSLRVSALALIVATYFVGPTLAETIDFEMIGVPGEPPKGFTAATTGRGKSAEWKLEAVTGAPSGKLAVIQRSDDPAAARFPVLVYDGLTVRDADISVSFKAVSGKEDQAAGLVWRYIDKNNYYVVRANALEDNVVLYIVKDGKRVDLPLKGKGKTYGAKAPVIKGGWNVLGVMVKGSAFKVIFNGKELYEVEDQAIASAGKIGLWTKADSVMLFDDLSIENAK